MVPAAMGVILFIAFWVCLGLALFVIALTGGPRQARERVLQTQSRRGRRNIGLALAILCVAFGVAIPVVVIASGERSAKAGNADIGLTAAEKRGRLLFGHTCNQCHTLAASRTVGRTGPDLDERVGPLSGANAGESLKIKREFVLNAPQRAGFTTSELCRRFPVLIGCPPVHDC
jgi:hypothetical protein